MKPELRKSTLLANQSARVMIDAVIPLQGQIAGRIEQLEGDKAKATSASHRKKLQKEQDDLKKQQTELLTFEEKLKHAADQKISLDLDDGVKVNYAKFGDLLADSRRFAERKRTIEPWMTLNARIMKTDRTKRLL